MFNRFFVILVSHNALLGTKSLPILYQRLNFEQYFVSTKCSKGKLNINYFLRLYSLRMQAEDFLFVLDDFFNVEMQVFMKLTNL